MRVKVLFLVFFGFLCSQISKAQLLEQQFGSSTTVSSYVSATPNNGQWDAISTSGAGTVLSINTTTSNKLRFARTGNAGAFSRTTDFSPTPGSVYYRFDLTVSGNSTAVTNLAAFQVGSGFTTGNSTEANASVHSRIGLNWTTTAGQFSLRDIGGSVNTANYTGLQTIHWIINNSGAVLYYRGPNGVEESVANDTFDLWIGTTKELNDAAATTASQTLTDLKFAISNGSGNVDIDNILIDPVPAIPTSSAATSITATGFTANWATVSGANGYYLDVSTNNSFSSFVSGYNNLYVSGGSTISQVVTGLSASTPYFYRVRAAGTYTVGNIQGGNSTTQNPTTSAGSGVDGTITAGEYGTHTDGNNQQTSGSSVTYMKWDSTNLYVGVSGASLSEGFVMYLDKDPQSLVNGGTNANGTNVGNGYDGTNFAELQFRADLVLYVKSGYREYRTANGSNGWSTATTAFGSYAEAGTVREFSIPWSAIGGMPSSFNFFNYVTSSGGFVYAQTPTENAAGSIGTSARYSRYYTVSTTTIGSSTPPFSRNSYVFNSAGDVTSFGAISCYDFTMNTSGRYLSRSGNVGGNWVIGGNLNVGNGTIYLGSTGGSYGTTTVAGNLNVSGGSFNMDQTNGSVTVNGSLNITGGSYDMSAASAATNVVGSVSIASGATLSLSSASGGDLAVGGDFTVGATATQTNNGRVVKFNGPTGAQNIIKTGGGNVFFDYLVLDKLAGNVVVNSATDVTINSTTGNVLQFNNNGNLDLNGRSLTLNNAGGSIYTNFTGRTITSSTAAQVNINGNKSVAYNNSGSDELIFDTNITVHVTNASMDFGAGKAYVNGTLQLNANGGVAAAPIYGNASTLRYWYNGSGSVYGRFNEWSASGVGTIGTTKGYPNNVQISNTTVLDLGANGGASTPRALAGTLTIDDGAEMRMTGSSAMSQALTVGNNLVVGQSGTATLNLSGTFGGDLKVGGNVTFNGTYVFNTNNRSVYFTKNGTQTVTAPVGRPSTFSYITFQPASGATTLQLVGADMTISPSSTGDLLTFNSASDVFDLNGRTLTLGNASFTNAVAGLGTFKGSTASNMTLIGTGSIGTLRFTSGSQALGTLTMTRQSGIVGATLGTDVTINTALVLTNGLINLSTFNMTLAAAATTSGASANSFVIADGTGEMRKTYAGTGSFTFPVGDNTGTAEFSPATLNFTAGSFSAAYAGIRVIDAKQPNNSAPTNFITRYWSIGASGITSPTYNFSGTYVAADINGTETTSDSGRWDGAGWTLGATLASNTVSITGLTTLTATNHCTGGNPLAPAEIDVQGNSVSIANADATPSTADHTDFGSVTYGSTVVRTFTIRNTGASALTLSGTPRVQLSGSSSFAVTTQPSSATIASNGSLTFQVTYTAGAFTAENATVSISNSDSDEGTYTFAITGIGTPSAASDIIASGTYTYNSNINYATYQAATITNTSNSIDFFRFDIRDGGASADADALPTILSAITFNVTNTSMIRSAALFNGNALVNASPTINTGAGTIAFSGLSYSAADGTTASLTLRVTFQSTVTDNTQFQVTIGNAGVTAAGGSTSSLFTAFTSVVSSTTTNRNRIVVTADRLVFVQQPTTTTVSAAMTPSVTVAGVDVNGNRDLDYTGTISITSTGTLTGSPVGVAAVSGLATFSSLTHTVAGTGLILTAATTGLGFDNDVDSNAFVISAIIYANNDYRSKSSGTWLGASPTSTWQQYNSGTNTWSDSTAPAANTSSSIYVQNGHTITTGNQFANLVNIKVMSGGSFVSSFNSTANSIYIYDGGTFTFQSNSLTINNGFEIEDNGTFIFDYAANAGSTLTGSLWKGTENFHPNSNFIVRTHDTGSGRFFLPVDTNISSQTYNGVTSYFGNLIFDMATGSQTGTFRITSGGNFNNKILTHKDLIFRSSSNNTIHFSDTSVNFTIGGNLTIESGYADNITLTTSQITSTITVKGDFKNNSAKSFSVVNQTGSATINLDVEGNLSVPNAGTVNLNSATGSSTASSSINLKGDLSLGTSALLLSTSTSGGTVNFKGTGDGLTAATTQTIDIASTGATENQYVTFIPNSGSYVQLANRDLELGTSGKVTVNSGSVFDFGFSGTTALLVKEVPAAATGTSFLLNSGGTLKITSPLGITASGNGNVQTDTRTYTPASSTFHYIGKANQETGDGITSASNSKTIVCELDTDTLQLALTNSTAITTPGLLNIKKGQVIETTSNYITGSTGGLSMSANTLYQVAALSSSGTDVIPRLDGISSAYSLTGGTIELNGGGSQILRGSRDYRNLTFSNTGNKSTSSSITNITGTVTIANSVVLDVANRGFGGSGTNLTMTGTSQFKNSGAGSKPDAAGTYSLSTGSTIEFYGTAATIIRLGSPINYGNVVVNGTNVSTSSAVTGLRMQSGTTFTVKNNATFRMINTDGFSGATTTAIDNTNTPSIVLETGSTIDYTGASQSLTAFSPSYYNLKVSGSGIKTIPGSSEVLVGNDLSVTAGTLQVDANKLLTVTNSIATIDNGIEVKNNGNLVQITDGISDTGKIIATRTCRSMILDDYVYWGSPVQEDVFSQLPAFFDASYQWELTGNYDGYWNGLAATTPGRGFITRAGADGNASFNFNGVPNNGVVTVYGDSFDDGVTQSSGNSILLSNPYPSAIDATAFVTDPANDGKIGGTLYFWTSFTGYTGGQYNTNDYATWNLSGATGVKASTDETGTDDLKPTGKIGTGQGFFAVLLQDYNVTFNNSMRIRTTNQNTQFFRDGSGAAAGNENGHLWLNMTDGNGGFRQTLVAYVDGATNDFDTLYDGMSFTANQINFYSISADKSLVIQGRQLPFDNQDLVPMGFRIANSGNFTIAIDSKDGVFDDNQDVFLEDLQLGIIHDLKSSPYQFSADAGLYNNRFVLRYTNGTLGTDNPIVGNEVTVAVEKDKLSIRSVMQPMTEIAVYDVAGRKVFESQNINANEYSANDIVLNHQTLIVKIKLENGAIVTKKIVY
ncbi:choice-of-anchor D domain-containing protein [Flavobacterium sp. BFFFF1]|uniref:choice-of-anchor D domain-containing protein n=1 Tax=Flavobacterium sp. BFFFF1 TaxID=2015557 RepID=UPI0025BA77DA|nr:choice-of-anchor D domain-containing protein [Flavobacterium sp. BFFFF1]